MTLERPMFPPVDQARRHFLTVATVGAVAVAIPTAALTAPTDDPIYAAIELHKDLAKRFDAAWEVRTRCKDFGETAEEKAHVQNLNDAIDEIGLPLEAAAMDLFNTAPTTHAGIIAAIRYIRIQHGNGGDHMVQGWLENNSTHATVIPLGEIPEQKLTPEDNDSLPKFVRYLKQYIVQEFARGRDVDEIFDDLEGTYRQAEQAKKRLQARRNRASETSDFPVNLPVPDLGQSVLNLATEHDQ
jgi:hypothetical protein